MPAFAVHTCRLPVVSVRLGYIVAVAALTAAGFGLRLAVSRGDLWLDEIWSVQNIERLSNPLAVAWAISQDNNHVLNSFWLWFTNGSGSPFLMRALSVAFGTASIPLAARIASRGGGVPAGLVAALLVAIGAPFVTYGSEARGYAGLMFGLLWAWDILDKNADDPTGPAARRLFACAAALATLSHLAALLPLASMVLAAAARLRPFRRALDAAVSLGATLIVGATPALACVAAGIAATGAFRTGAQQPFTVAGLVDGIGGLFGAFAGAADLSATGPALAIATLLAAVALAIAPAPRRLLPLALLLGPPLVDVVLRVPNVHIPRFHLAMALALVLLLSEAFGAAWRMAPSIRGLAVCLLAGSSALALVATSDLLMLGRGQFADAVRLMTADGPTTVASNLPVETARTLRYGTERQHLPAIAFTAEPAGAAWFVFVEDNRAPPDDPLIRTFGRAGTPFTRAATYPYAGLSGFRWTLYRRSGAS